MLALSYSVITFVLSVRTDGFTAGAMGYINEGGGYVFTRGGGLASACKIQAGLVYAASVLVANTTLGLIIQVSGIGVTFF